MICPTCNHDNLPGAEVCEGCQTDLTQLDQPTAANRVERSLMEELVAALRPRPALTVSPRSTVAEALRTMLAHDIGAVLVVDATGKLLGIFSERDLLTRVGEQYATLSGEPVEKYMTPRPEAVSVSAPLLHALHKMDNGGYRHLPVLDGDVAHGMISVRDMLRHITQLCKSPDPIR
jgi:CBS domain-containing protein